MTSRFRLNLGPSMSVALASTNPATVETNLMAGTSGATNAPVVTDTRVDHRAKRGGQGHS